MEIKAELNNATEEQKLDFIVEYNHNKGYTIEQEIANEEEVVDEEGNTTIVYTYNLKALSYTEEEIEQQEKERIAKLNLTGADVERGIYQAKGMDFDDIVAMVTQLQPEGLDIKALKIELKANNFYRGNPYVDAVGALLGFTSKQLDNFFETNNYEALILLEEEDDDNTTDTTDEPADIPVQPQDEDGLQEGEITD